jgi:hypothetical protein
LAKQLAIRSPEFALNATVSITPDAEFMGINGDDYLGKRLIIFFWPTNMPQRGRDIARAGSSPDGRPRAVQ